MNYSTDRPIDREEQDLLGRSFFSKQLGKAIYEYNGKDGLVIGLFGKWGTGKTSVINMAINEINKLAENDKNKPMIMKFAPWNYSDKNNLISLFFQSLKNKIEVQNNKEFKKKVGKALNDYSGAFDALLFVPGVSSGFVKSLKSLARVLGDNLREKVDLDRTKDILEKALIKANKKIIVVIDDIDRLTNSQIRDVFQLVKQVADFPNVIYVLAMDREVVRSALTEVHNIDGNEYLEKIIQIPFELPELRKLRLHDIFFTKLDQITNNLPDKVVWDKSYWSNVFRNCIEPYINTLRDVNRVTNTFQFRYEMLYQETSFEDMVGITALEVLEPKLYKWICNNKDAVCGGDMHELLSNIGDKPDYRKLYHDQFESLGIDPDLAISCVSTMFPAFAKDVNEYNYDYQSTSDNIIGKMRVAHEERFELYFMFDLEDIKVSRSIINDCIYRFDRDTLSTAIDEINKQGNIIYFLEEIKSLVGKIPYERLGLIASVMLGLQGEFKGGNTRSNFAMSACIISEDLVYNIIRRLETEEEKYEIIRSAVENVNKTGLGSMAEIINRIELAYGKLAGDSERKDEQIISLVHLKELEKIYVARIHAIANSESILDINEFSLVFYLWECFDKDGAAGYLKKLFKNEVNKLKFIFIMGDNVNNGDHWGFYAKKYVSSIPRKEIYDTIRNFDKKNLDKFTEIEQIKLASFVLNYHKHELNHVSEEEALKLVNEWKTGKEEQENSEINCKNPSLSD